MDINEIQRQMVKIAETTSQKKNYALTPEMSFIKLTEEVGEIARQLTNKTLRPHKYNEENLKEEIIDTLFDVLVLAHLCNVDLIEGSKNKLNILNKKHDVK